MVSWTVAPRLGFPVTRSIRLCTVSCGSDPDRNLSSVFSMPVAL